MHEKSVLNIRKLKYPRIFEESGVADVIICPIGQTFDTLLASFFCAVGDNDRMFSFTWWRCRIMIHDS